jgi:hypothetical protein
MITPEAWYGCFEAYNMTWLPAVVISWLALIICTYLLFAKPSDKTNVLMKACLAFVFAWNGIVFFFMYMKSSAILGGIPMIVIAILFTVDIFRNKIKFRFPEARWQKYLILFLIVWALGLYTITGLLTGHSYPRVPLPAAPCPTTILAIALLSTAMPTLKIDRFLFTVLFILLLWWAFFAGLGAPFAFGFYVDLSLFATGAYGLVMLVKHWRV